MKQRNWIWVVIFAAIFAGCLALWLLPRGGGETVLVYQDGQLLRTLDLRQDTVFTVEGPAGENTVTVAGGEVFVSQADCPDQVCVLHGPLRRTGGLFAYIGMLALRRWFSGRRLWILSVFCAMAHNFGQLCAAALIARTRAVWYYLPVLLPAAILAGALTGLCTQLLLQRLGRAGLLPADKKQEEEANG